MLAAPDFDAPMPEPKGRQGKYIYIIDALKARPGEWGKVDTTADGVKWAPASALRKHGVVVAQRKVGDVINWYAMWPAD